MTTQINLHDHIKLNVAGKIVTGTVLHKTSSKIKIFVHSHVPTDFRVSTCTANAATLKCEKVELKDVPAVFHPFIEKLTGFTKSDFVKVTHSDKREFIGKLDKLTAKGYEISDINQTILYPYGFFVEKTTPKVVEPAMPLDNWSVKLKNTGYAHDSGGTCMKFEYFYKDKKVLVAIEDAMGGETDIQSLTDVNGKKAALAFQDDVIESFKIVGLSEDRHFFADDPACFGIWMNMRGLCSLHDHFKN